MHRDDEGAIDPNSTIAAVSIGAERILSFTNGETTEDQSLTVKDGSLYVMSRFSQDFW